MEFKYKEALAKYKLTENDLTEDAQIGIKGINDIMKAVSMLEKRGKQPTSALSKKLTAMDKWVYYEILDQMHETNNNADEMPLTEEEMKAEAEKIKNTPAKKPAETEVAKSEDEALGILIEQELIEMVATSQTSWTIEQIKPIAPNTYSLLFNTYESGKENGVKTTKHSLLETEPKLFTLN